MTFQQIAEKYKSEEVARRIVEAKLADPELRRTQVKDHPDCPESEAGFWKSGRLDYMKTTRVEPGFDCWSCWNKSACVKLPI